MKTRTQDEIDDRFGKLPNVLQDALFDPKIAQKIFAIGDQFELTIEQIGFLAEETGFVMLGFTRPNMFKDAIKERLGVDNTRGESIAHEINNQIFFLLREAMKSSLGIDIVQKKTLEPVKPSIPSEPKPSPPEHERPKPEIMDVRKENGEIKDKRPVREKKTEELPQTPPKEPPYISSKIPFFNIRPVPKEPLPRQSEIPQKPEIMPGGGMMSIPTMPLNHKPALPQEKDTAPPKEPKKHIQEDVPEKKEDVILTAGKPPLPEGERKDPGGDPYKESFE